MKFELKGNEGWIMETEKQLGYCGWCHKELKVPFMFCEAIERGFCYNCETKEKRILCFNAKEHCHLKIIEVKKG